MSPTCPSSSVTTRSSESFSSPSSQPSRQDPEPLRGVDFPDVHERERLPGRLIGSVQLAALEVGGRERPLAVVRVGHA